jgi:hypothetical protein
MSIGVEAFKRMSELKSQEITDYFTMHEDIIRPFLELQKEYREIESRAHRARMNEVEHVMAKLKGSIVK